jgi:hypothetical protein
MLEGFDIPFIQLIAALFATPAGIGNHPAQFRVSLAMRAEQDEFQILKAHQTAHQQFDGQSMAFDGGIGPDHARHGTLVGDGDGLVTQAIRLGDQFLRMRGAGEK